MVHLRLILASMSTACVAVFILAVNSLLAEEGDYTIRFRDVTERAGLIEPLEGLLGHGGAVGDYDGDGHLDIYVGGFADRPDSEYSPAKGPVSNRLLRNDGKGQFEV